MPENPYATLTVLVHICVAGSALFRVGFRKVPQGSRKRSRKQQSSCDQGLRMAPETPPENNIKNHRENPARFPQASRKQKPPSPSPPQKQSVQPTPSRPSVFPTPSCAVRAHCACTRRGAGLHFLSPLGAHLRHCVLRLCCGAWVPARSRKVPARNPASSIQMNLP